MSVFRSGGFLLLGGIRAISRSFEPSPLTGLANQQIPELSGVYFQNSFPVNELNTQAEKIEPANILNML